MKWVFCQRLLHLSAGLQEKALQVSQRKQGPQRCQCLLLLAACQCSDRLWRNVEFFFTKSCRVNHNLSIDWKGDPMWNSFEWLAPIWELEELENWRRKARCSWRGFPPYMMQFLYRLCRLMPPIDNTRFCPNTNGTALRSELYKKRLGCVRWGTRNASRV